MGNSISHDYLPVWDPELKILDLRHNIDYHQYLKHMNGDYDDSCLSDLPSNILEEISLYETLFASFNCLTAVPSALPLHLPHLSYVDLSHNQLNELPGSFGLFFHLRTVVLCHNLLRNLPQSFVNLRKLEKVDLSYNKLASLPDEIGNLKELQRLNVSHNRLRRLPQSIVHCQSLRIILGNDNMCVEPPQDLCDAGSAEILSYIRKNFPDSFQAAGSKRLMSEDDEFDGGGENFIRIKGNQVQSPILNPNSPRAQYVQAQTKTLNTPCRIKTPLLLPNSATIFSPMQLRDKIIGLLYGAAVGDAVGIAMDFMSPDECQFYYNMDTFSYNDIVLDGHRVHWRKGDWTSNTDHMLLVLDSIVHWAGVVDELDFADKLLQWKEHGLGENSAGPGHTVSRVINEVVEMEDFGTCPHSSASRLLRRSCNGGTGDSSTITGPFNDNAALPRALILGVPHFYDLREVASNAIRICKATHADPLSIATCVSLSIIIALILQGQHNLASDLEMEELLARSRMLALEQLVDTKHIKTLNKCFSGEYINRVYSKSPVQRSNPSTSLCAAIHTLRFGKDFKSAISDLVMMGGHSSVNACLAGALMGCAKGFAELPNMWVKGLNADRLAWLNSKINALLDMIGLP